MVRLFFLGCHPLMLVLRRLATFGRTLKRMLEWLTV
jgi:hypothetical protein